jgi:hypothetical protein
MLHRFRRAMVRPGRDKLKGLVEVDETYLSITVVCGPDCNGLAGAA